MPTSNFARVDLDQLYLPFLQKLLDAVAQCNAQGVTYVATLGYRTFEQQAKLYFQGRTMPGPKVTNAGPGESAHNYGLACDFVCMRDGQPDWRGESYQLLGDEAKKAGLVWGGDFKGLVDDPHVQWPGYVTGAELAPLKTVYLANQGAPLSAVFDFLNSKGVA